jgi:lipoic acid synthetase
LSSVVTTVSPDGRKMLRLEVRNAETPIEKKPSWIRTRAKMGPEYTALKSLVQTQGLSTVCEQAACPNIYECWEDREATFLIGGDQCTRRCDFCNIDTGKPAAVRHRRAAPGGRVGGSDGAEVRHVTGVARDDLPDGGAWLYAETVRQIHAAMPGIGVELLIPDFNGIPTCWTRSSPRPRGARAQRRDGAADLQEHPPGFRYDRSLDVIRRPRGRARHQEQPHPGHGRGPRRGHPGAAGPARRRLRADHHHAVPAARRRGTTR